MGRYKHYPTYQPHEATFRGKHNAAKAKTLIYLFDRYQNQQRSLSAGEIHQETGVLLTTLRSKLGKWVKWGYVNRRLAHRNGQPCFSYTIGERGARFVTERIGVWRKNRYHEEILDWLSKKQGKGY